MLWPESSALTAARYSIDVRPDNHALAKFGHTVWPESRMQGEARYGHTVQPQNRVLIRPAPFDPRGKKFFVPERSLPSRGNSTQPTKAGLNRSGRPIGSPAGVRLPTSSQLRDLQQARPQVSRWRAAIDDPTLPIEEAIDAALVPRAREGAARAQR